MINSAFLNEVDRYHFFPVIFCFNENNQLFEMQLKCNLNMYFHKFCEDNWELRMFILKKKKVIKLLTRIICLQDMDVNKLINGRTLLHYAADYGQSDVLGYLLEKGADANVSQCCFIIFNLITFT